MENIDSAVEASRAADVDAHFQITGEASHVYNAQTWHQDCADYLIADKESSDYIRRQLINAFAHMGSFDLRTPRGKMLQAQCLNMCLINIGQQVIENAIKNGLTAEMVGE